MTRTLYLFLGTVVLFIALVWVVRSDFVAPEPYYVDSSEKTGVVHYSRFAQDIAIGSDGSVSVIKISDTGTTTAWLIGSQWVKKYKWCRDNRPTTFDDTEMCASLDLDVQAIFNKYPDL